MKFLAGAALAAGLFVLGGGATLVRNAIYSTSEPTTATAPVVNVVDGDTMDVLLDGQKTRLRLIGVDTPETVDLRKPVQCYGPEASKRAHQLLDGQTVKVTTDPSQGDKDKYGRKLAYVWLPDGRNYAETMIHDGYAREYTYDKAYQYKSAFQKAQADAQSKNVGLWGACAHTP